MKKVFLISILCLGFFSGCGKKEPLPMLLPTDVISLTTAQEIIGDDYTLVMKDNAVKQEENLLSVKYLSDPPGSGDSIFINLLSPDSEHDDEFIKTQFLHSREKRSDTITVKGLGDDAYITYPSLHLYTQGHYLKITAGSNSSDAQAELLVELGKIAVENIDNFYSSNFIN